MHSIVPIVGNQLATLLLGILSLKLISKYVPPEINGSYALFVTLTQVGLMITHSGVINHATRYWQRESTQAGTYARFLWQQIWQRSAYLTILLLLISVGVGLWYTDFNWIVLFPWLVASNITTALALLATGVLNADRSPWRVLLLGVLGGAARVLLPIGLALLTSVTFVMLSIGYSLQGIVVLGILFAIFWWAMGAFAPDKETAMKWGREMRDYGRPFVWMGIGAWLLQNADRWIVYNFFDESKAGLFAYASNIGAIIPALVLGGLMQWVLPTIFRQADTAKTSQEWKQMARKCDQATGAFLALTIGCFLLFIAFSDLLIGPVISLNYLPAVGMVLPAGFAMATLQVNQFYFLLMQGQHDSAGMVKVMLLIAGAKTIGSVVAASISWQAFLGWLIAALFLAVLAGRYMVRRAVLRRIEIELGEVKV
jgi:O-antigen/teichoic acid export membrane protein